MGPEEKRGAASLSAPHNTVYTALLNVSARFRRPTRQTETSQTGAEQREAGRLRSGHRRDIDAWRRLQREVRRASIGYSVRTEDDGSAVVEHGGRVDVGEEVGGTASIEISGGRHLSAVPCRIGRSAGTCNESLQAVAVESEQAAANASLPVKLSEVIVLPELLMMPTRSLSPPSYGFRVGDGRAKRAAGSSSDDDIARRDRGDRWTRNGVRGTTGEERGSAAIAPAIR